MFAAFLPRCSLRRADPRDRRICCEIELATYAGDRDIERSRGGCLILSWISHATLPNKDDESIVCTNGRECFRRCDERVKVER